MGKELRTEVSAAPHASAAIEAYLANRELRAQAGGDAQAVRARLDEIGTAKGPASSAAAEADLDRQLEDVLAAEAEGGVTASEAASRREEIERERAALAPGIQAERDHAQAQQLTRNGLQRRADELRSRIGSLDAEARLLLERILRERAEERGALYIAQAREVYSTVMQLMAIDSLLSSVRGHRKGRIAKGSLQKFYLPSFELPGFEALSRPNLPDQLFTTAGWSTNIDSDLADITAEEQKRLQEIGVQL